MVRRDSASGSAKDGRAARFDAENICHLGGLDHLELLNHPKVYQRIHGWLEAGDRRVGAEAP